MIAALIVASAAVSLGFARYLGYFVDMDIRLAPVCLLAFIAVVAIFGIEESARLTLVLSTVQVGGLIFVIVVGAPDVSNVSDPGWRLRRRGARVLCVRRLRRGDHALGRD